MAALSSPLRRQANPSYKDVEVCLWYPATVQFTRLAYSNITHLPISKSLLSASSHDFLVYNSSNRVLAMVSKPRSALAGHTAGIFADMTLDGPEIGTLVVVVDRAKNLPNRKTMGKQDPYCAMRLGKEAKKTDTDRRGGQTPKWDQELRFTVHNSPDYYRLKVSCFNDDKKTDLIGDAFIDLRELIRPGGGSNDLWHQLNYKGKYAGDIRMEMTYYDTRPREEQYVERKRAKERASTSDSISDAPVPSTGPRQLGPREIRRRPLPTSPGQTAPAHTSSAAMSQPLQQSSVLSAISQSSEQAQHTVQPSHDDYAPDLSNTHQPTPKFSTAYERSQEAPIPPPKLPLHSYSDSDSIQFSHSSLGTFQQIQSAPSLPQVDSYATQEAHKGYQIAEYTHDQHLCQEPDQYGQPARYQYEVQPEQRRISYQETAQGRRQSSFNEQQHFSTSGNSRSMAATVEDVSSYEEEQPWQEQDRRASYYSPHQGYDASMYLDTPRESLTSSLTYTQRQQGFDETDDCPPPPPRHQIGVRSSQFPPSRNNSYENKMPSDLQQIVRAAPLPQPQSSFATFNSAIVRPVARKAVSPGPHPTDNRRYDAVPFSPDAYDVLNPACSPTTNENTIFETSSQAKDAARIREAERSRELGPIIGNDGREIDPSDHLPEDTWAPEPERKQRRPEHVIHYRTKNASRVHTAPASQKNAPFRDLPGSPIGGSLDSVPSSTHRNRLRKAMPQRTLPSQPHQVPQPVSNAGHMTQNQQSHHRHSYHEPPSTTHRPSLSEYQVPTGNSYIPRASMYQNSISTPPRLSTGSGHVGNGYEDPLTAEINMIDIGPPRNLRTMVRSGRGY